MRRRYKTLPAILCFTAVAAGAFSAADNSTSPAFAASDKLAPSPVLIDTPGYADAAWETKTLPMVENRMPRTPGEPAPRTIRAR